MAEKMSVKICVVWEHELRVAAKALHNAEMLAKEMDQVVNQTAEQKADLKMRWNVAAQEALQACFAALYGCQDDNVAITVSAAPKSRGG
jgi:hypothetical protein